MTTMMTLDRFETAALAWGGDLSRWPEPLRREAEALCTAQPERTRDLIAAAGRLDLALAAAPAAPASLALRSRVIAAASRSRPTGWSLGEALRGIIGAGVGAALAASCIAGVLAGVLANAEGFSPSRLAKAQDPGVEAMQLLRGSQDPADGSWSA